MQFKCQKYVPNMHLLITNELFYLFFIFNLKYMFYIHNFNTKKLLLCESGVKYVKKLRQNPIYKCLFLNND